MGSQKGEEKNQDATRVEDGEKKGRAHEKKGVKATTSSVSFSFLAKVNPLGERRK